MGYKWALNKQRGHGNEIFDLRLRHFSTGITGLSGPDPALIQLHDDHNHDHTRGQPMRMNIGACMLHN